MSWNRVGVFLWLVQTVVSSTNIMALLLVNQLLKSFSYIRSRSGPKIDPYGKPIVRLTLTLSNPIPSEQESRLLI